VILVAEKANEVLDLADVLVFMELGRVVWSGARDEASAEQLAAAYLGITS
jgi:ABC-type branched-subunit amino acid transport system ATPase component